MCVELLLTQTWFPSQSDHATGTKDGGQELIGGLDVHIQRNYFGRQLKRFVHIYLHCIYENVYNLQTTPTFPTLIASSFR